VSRQPHVIEVYGNNAAVICPGCPTIFLTASIHPNGRKCPHCGGWIAKLKRDNKTVIFSKVSVPASTGKD
jgi:rRNA maturation endonuclease Nob1